MNGIKLKRDITNLSPLKNKKLALTITNNNSSKKIPEVKTTSKILEKFKQQKKGNLNQKINIPLNSKDEIKEIQINTLNSSNFKKSNLNKNQTIIKVGKKENINNTENYNQINSLYENKNLTTNSYTNEIKKPENFIDQIKLNVRDSYSNLLPDAKNKIKMKYRDLSVNPRRPTHICLSSNINQISNLDSISKESNLIINKNLKRENTKKLYIKAGILNTTNPSNIKSLNIVTTPTKRIKINFKQNKLTEEIAILKAKDDPEFFEYEEEKKETLSNEEKLIYGNREPKDYKKIKLLGKGGCGIVWLCEDSNKNEFAVKQIAKKNKSEFNKDLTNASALIARREIEILNYLGKQDLQNENNIINLIDFIEDKEDIWLIFDKGGKSISNLIFKIKGEFLGNERIYLIKKGKFLMELFDDINNLKNFMKKILSFIKFLNENGIVHCDLKPENILINYNNDSDIKSAIQDLKIIDFGSAFYINNPENFSSNTPEYMSPEITELIEKNATSKEISIFLKKLSQWPSCIDIWSLGVTILEIALSCPLWMSYKAKVVIHGKSIYKTGLFGVKGRDGARIHTKQIEVSNSIPKLMNESLIKEEKDRNLLSDLLSQMLDFNYKSRISPTDALNHPFFQN